MAATRRTQRPSQPHSVMSPDWRLPEHRREVTRDEIREALTLATQAFAQYALDTDAPAPDAVAGFVDGFIQDARLRRERARGNDGPQGMRGPYDLLTVMSAFGWVGNTHYCPGCMNEFWADAGQHEPDCPTLRDIMDDMRRGLADFDESGMKA